MSISYENLNSIPMKIQVNLSGNEKSHVGETYLKENVIQQKKSKYISKPSTMKILNTFQINKTNKETFKKTTEKEMRMR